MFDPNVHEEMINDLNPLINIELSFDNNTGVFEDSKFLSFKFRRIFKNDKIEENDQKLLFY